MACKSIEVRYAQAADLFGIEHINERAGGLFNGLGLIGTPNGLPERIPAACLETALFERLLLVGQMNGRLAGFALCTTERPDLYLEQISVAPEFGRCGVGAALLGAVSAEAERRHLFGVTLSTFRHVPWNAPFYAKHGFTEIPRRGLALWQLDIEKAQSATMDVRQRCFMRRAVAANIAAAHAA
ncbi:MAG: GNAT family N-acetyltransferase [Caulobacterales bacterium]